MEGPKDRGSAVPEEALNLLGLAVRAGAVAPGVAQARAAIRAGRARLVILASDAADAQRGKVDRLAQVRGVSLRWGGDRAALGRALGKGPISAVAVLQDEFAQELGRRLSPVDAGGAGRSNGGR